MTDDWLKNSNERVEEWLTNNMITADDDGGEEDSVVIDHTNDDDDGDDHEEDIYITYCYIIFTFCNFVTSGLFCFV